jgi:hypothetical protein
VHHRLFVCSNAREQKSNTVANTTVINITPGSERLSATGLKVRDTLQVPACLVLGHCRAVALNTLALYQCHRLCFRYSKVGIAFC